MPMTGLSMLAEIVPLPNLRPLGENIFGCEALLLLKTALESGIFDVLGESGRSSGALATVLGDDSRRRTAFLDALVSLGYLEKEGESYRLSPSSSLYLRRDSKHSVYGLLRSRFARLQRLHNIVPILREPLSPGSKEPRDEEDLLPFTGLMAQSAVSSGAIGPVVRKIARDPAFRDARKMIDLGCSHGLYTAALCLLNKTMQAVLFDRPGVLQLTRRYLESFPFEDRLEYRGGDFYTDPLGENYDLAFASNVFYRSSGKVAPLLLKIHRALKPGGVLYLQHRYLKRDRSAPAPAALYYCTRVLLSPSFYVSTLPEALADLQQAGFAITSIHRSKRTGNTLLRARSQRGRRRS